MQKPDIARRIARQAGVSPAEAADRLDNLVREILSELKRGREPALPGLGRFRQTVHGKLIFERQRTGRRHG
jgi:nucleoid DNA-binding protein